MPVRRRLPGEGNPWTPFRVTTQPRRQRPRRSISYESKNQNGRLACPFHKFAPGKYVAYPRNLGEENPSVYESCGGPGFMTVQSLKEHLKRKHYPVKCPRCYKTFTDQSRDKIQTQLEQHLRLLEPCVLGDPSLEKGINDAQWSELTKITESDYSPVENWFRLWEILFPGVARPNSPWYDGGNKPADSQGSLTELFPERERPKRLANAEAHCDDGSDLEGTPGDKAGPNYGKSNALSPVDFEKKKFTFETSGPASEKLADMEENEFNRRDIVDMVHMKEGSIGHVNALLGLALSIDGYDHFASAIFNNNPGTESGNTFLAPSSLHVSENQTFFDSALGSSMAQTLKNQVYIQTSLLANNQANEIQPAVEYGTGSSAENYSYSPTRYSDTSSLRDPKVGEYVSELVDALCSAFPSDFDEEDLARMSESLPVLLKEFAVRLGDDAGDGDLAMIHGHLKYLTHRYCSQIIIQIQQKYTDKGDEVVSTSTSGMSLGDKMSLWQQNEDRELATVVPDSSSDDGLQDDLDDSLESDLQDLSRYRCALTQASSYEWLVQRLQVENDFSIPGPIPIKHMIRDQILQKIGRPSRISRKTQSYIHSIHFELDWNPVVFYLEQEYKEPLREVLARAITLTGHGDNVQAATCLQYMNQTWPGTGEKVLELLQRSSESRFATVETSILSDHTQLTAMPSPDHLRIMAKGNAFSIAEIGEQLAWLGAALRSSNQDNGVVYCRPFISDFNTLDSCKLAFRFESREADDTKTSGNCWQNLFRNPVVVIGYPIPRRSLPDSGLETSIDIMATLANAQRIADFGGRTFVKGFSRMLAATQVVEDTIFWHLFSNGNGGHVSYSDPRVPRELDQSQSLLVKNPEAQRHIVGWCERVKNYAGAPDANYDIGWSGLSTPNESCAFEKVSISGGKFLNLGITCALGIKDKPVQATIGGDYLGMLSMISERHFVLHDLDDGERRAWLIDGASALLHLLRASITHNQSNPRLRRIFCFDEDDFEEAHTTHTGLDAAFEVLSNCDNQNLPLYPKAPELWGEKTIKLGVRALPEEVIKEKTANFCLKNRVEQICNILEQIMAHQDDVSSQAGVGFRLRTTPRRQLEGFDFMDVAIGQGTLWPKVATLRATGAGWVDFARKIHAISLFGTGFGDLLKPASDKGGCYSCLWNSEVPKGKDYLAVSMVELKEILKRKGNMNRSPWRVVDNIYWHTPDKTFERCSCSETPLLKQERIQVFLPATFPKLWGRKLKSPSQLVTSGAVIFGHSWKFPLRWGALGDPEEGSPVPSIEENEPLFYDSGYGPSQYPSSMETPENSASPFQAPLQRGSLHAPSDPQLYTLSNHQFVYQDMYMRTSVTPELAAIKYPGFDGLIREKSKQRQCSQKTYSISGK